MRSVIVDGPAVKRAREMAGYTQPELAKKVGVDRSAIAHWESEKSPKQPSGANFKTLVKLLRVPRESLLVVADDQAA